MFRGQCIPMVTGGEVVEEQTPRVYSLGSESVASKKSHIIVSLMIVKGRGRRLAISVENTRLLGK